MKDINVFQILSLGVIGLGFFLALFSYKLLSTEQKKDEPRPAIIKAIYGFMLFSISLCIVGFLGETFHNNKGTKDQKVTKIPIKSKSLDEKDEKNDKDMNDGISILGTLLGKYDDRMLELENDTRKNILYYLENRNLPFKRRIELASGWVTTQLNVAKKHLDDTKYKQSQRLQELKKTDNEKNFKNNNDLEKGVLGISWFLLIADEGDTEKKIKLLEKLDEDLRLIMESKEEIDETAYINRINNLIYVKKDND